MTGRNYMNIFSNMRRTIIRIIIRQSPNKSTIQLIYEYNYFQSLDTGSILPLQGVCDPVTGNTPLMYAAMENKVAMVVMTVMMVMVVVVGVVLLLMMMKGPSSVCFCFTSDLFIFLFNFSFSSQLIFTFFTFYGTTQYYWPSGLH